MGSVYVNFIPEGDEHRVAEAYGPNFDRLSRIKQKVDPMNLFRGNQNIGADALRLAKRRRPPGSAGVAVEV
jgi:hypothetical protein